MSLPTPTRRHFTDAARAAAAARQRKREAAIPKDAPGIFVVRLPVAPLRFGWEIRRFGAVVLDRSSPDHPTTQAARSGGEAALVGHGVTPERLPRRPKAASTTLTRPAARIPTRQEAHEQIPHLCEAVLRTMARRRMH